MTPADWDYAFETLLKLHLVKVPDDYYDDALYFTNPSLLNAMFQKLEDENLRKIHQHQEQEVAYEKLLIEEQKSRLIKQTLYDSQN